MQNSRKDPAREPVLMPGNLHTDDRGSVGFVNDFDMSGIKRFYSVKNHRAGFVRAWHAHKQEGKYVTLIEGSAVIAAVPIDNWESPSKEAKIYRYVLSAHTPAVVFIPPGYANGFMTLTQDATLLFFSTATLEQSRQDDIRYDANYWNPWKVVER